MRISDWSSDVCSSDLYLFHRAAARGGRCRGGGCGGDGGAQRFEGLARGVGAAGRHQFLAFGGFGSVGFRCLFGLQVENIIAVGQLAGAARRSEENTSELQSLMRISYAVSCLQKKKHNLM